MIPTQQQMQSSATLGFVLGFALWLAGTVGFYTWPDQGQVVFATMGIAVVIAVARNLRRQSWMSAIVDEYVRRYGSAPPGFKGRATGVGWAAGSLSGNPVAGGLLGAAVDLFRMHKDQEGMSAEQRDLHERLKGLQAWSPFHSVYMLGVFLALSWAVAWVVGIWQKTGR